MGASRWVLPFFVGFIAGVLVWNFGGSSLTEQSGLLDEYTLDRVSNMELNHRVFFFYVLRHRIGVLWLLAMVSSTFAGVWFLYLYTVWLGLTGGILLSTAVIRYGIKGIFLVVTGCLPHYVFYLPAMMIALCMGYSFCTRLYYPDQNAGYDNINRRQLMIRYILIFLLLHIVVIIGAMLESYVNPTFVLRLLRIF
ncbi:MAG: stage II sporulation protein M [Lachnospiraceae bacterium]|nr:stage II sporulation protein M [Lachnospiraceae bacterium]